MKSITQKIFATVIIMVAMAFTANSQTTVPGGYVSGTWTLAGSPYLINGSIQIQDGQTLIIEPGVTVDFQGHYKLMVLGRLLAIGTAADTIRFMATDTAVGWQGIRFNNTPATNDTSKIIYCKIQNGKATNAGDDSGGGINITNCNKVIISNCCISDNYAKEGGGVCIMNSNIQFSDNKISHNVSSIRGGGILSASNNITISNNIISNNSSVNEGGGMSLWGNATKTNNNIITNNFAGTGGGICISGIAYLDNNIISSNTASNGGGLYTRLNSVVTMSNNTVTLNKSGGGIKSVFGGILTLINNLISYNSSVDGGGIACSCDSLYMTGNIISNNDATDKGGGMWLSSGKKYFIANNVFINNSAKKGGGIYSTNNDSQKFINNTIANNYATYGGALYCKSGSNPIFRNGIIYGNTASSGNQVFIEDEASDPDFYYCNVQGGSAAFDLNTNFYTGNYLNNIDTDPLFVAPTAGSGTSYNGLAADWSLQSGSPCIDAGDPDTTGLNLPATDLAGNPRITGAYIDMGAFEHGNCSAYFTLYPDTNIAHHYFITNLASGTAPITYTWDWGDGTTATGGNVSHTYNNSGYYNICLTITDATGCTDTYCYNSYLLKGTNDMVYIDVLFPVGIEEAATGDETIMVYPNPAKEQLSFKIQSPKPQIQNSKRGRYFIYGSFGQLISAGEIKSEETKINVSGFAKGLYLLKIENGDNVAVKRFIKE